VIRPTGTRSDESVCLITSESVESPIWPLSAVPHPLPVTGLTGAMVEMNTGTTVP